MSNEFDAAVAASLQPDQGQAARIGFSVAADTNPDAYAEAQRVARRTGVPVDTVLNMPKEMKRQDALGTIDFDTLAKTAPATASLLADVERAKVAHDDVGNMTTVERVARQFFGSAAENVGRSVHGFGELANVAQRRALAGFAGLFLPTPMAGGKPTEESLAGPLVGDDWRDLGKQTMDYYRQHVMVPANQQTFGDQVVGGLGQIGSQIAMLPIDRGASLWAQGASIVSEKVAGDNAPQINKDAAILGGSAVTGITERYALDKLLGPLAVPIKNQIAASLARIGIGAAAEGGQEFTENIGHDLLQKYLTNPDNQVNLGQAGQEGAVGATVGGIVRAVVEAGLHVKSRGERQAQQADKTEQNAQALQALADLSQASKLRQRDAESFAALVKDATAGGPLSEVFISGETLAQSPKAQQIAAASPSVAEQLPGALESGGDVRIPVEEFAAQIAGNGLAQDIINDLKTEPGGMTRTEAQVFRQAQDGQINLDELAGAADAHVRNLTHAEELRGISQQIAEQLDAAGRFSPAVTKAYAALPTAFFDTMAQRLGVSPSELWAAHGASITAEALGGRQFDQGATLNQLLTQWESAGIQADASERNGVITLSRIVVPEGARGQGKGTAAMQALIDYADRTGQHVALSPSSDFGGNKKRLVEFYKRFGFVENKGKNRAFSTTESMYRQAQGKVLHQFAGRRSQGADLHALDTAKQRLAAGENPETVRRETGWFKGADGKWRYEISDADAKFIGKDALEAAAEADPYKMTEMRLGDVLDHPALFAAYPKLRDITVAYEATSAAGGDLYFGASYNSAENTIMLGNGLDDAQLRSALLHEIQHGIQTVEGFATGGSLEIAGIVKAQAKREWDYWSNAYTVAREMSRGLTAEEAMAVLNELDFGITEDHVREAQSRTLEELKAKNDAAERELRRTGDGPRATYLKIAGEVEARNTQARADMTDAERQATPPSATADTADRDVILVFNGEEMESAPPPANAQRAIEGAVTSISGEEIAPHDTDTKTLRDAARQWYDANLRGTSVVNAASGKAIEFRKASKSFNASANPEKLRLFAALREVVAKGEIRSTTEPTDQARRQNVKAYHWLTATVELDGKPVQVGVTLREDNRGHLYYNHNPVETKASPASELGDTAHKAGAGTNEGEAFEQSVAPAGGDINLEILAQGEQAPRGSFNPATNTIALLKHADLSTALHEFGHYFLEVTANVAADLNAPAQIRQDMQTVLDWFGVPDLETWQAMPLDEKRPYHEKYARGFEAYLMEGRAPSIELQGLFQRFRSWLARVYRELKALNVELTDEVRGVFDRMLATEEHIQEAERARALSPMFSSPEMAAEHGIDWQQYQELGKDATADAIGTMEARSLRDMTWTAKLREATIKRLNRDATDKRKEARREVEAEVRAEPIYQAMRWLKRGEMTTPAGEEIKAEAGHRLSIPALREMFPDSALGAVEWQRLGYGKYGMLAEEGLHPDMVAEMFGFRSGDALVRQLLDAEPFRAKVEALTDLRMLERHGDLTSPEGIAKAADEAIHNDVRTRFLATELAGLQKAVGGARVLAQMAKDYAAKLIGKTKAGAIRPTQYAAAEVRAGRAAEAALKKGDIAEAIRQKRFQMINHAATRAAYEAQDEVQKTAGFFRAVATGGAETVGKTRNMDIVNAARAILAEYGVGMRGKNPRAYMEAVKAYDPELFAVLEPMLQDAEQGAKPFTDLTVGELRALRDNIESLWYLARRERQVEIDGKLIDREQISEALTGRLEELGVPDSAPGEEHAATEGEKRARYLMGLRAALRRVEAWVDRMDGGQITGAFRRYVFQPISEAADAYRTDAGAYLKRYRDLLKAIEPTLKAGRIDAPELGYTFGYSRGDAGKAELLHAILHTGNESNKRKLLLGRNWATEQQNGSLDTSRWDAFIQRMHAEGKLTQADYDFAQGVWDLLEEIKPLAQKTHREVFGRYFDEVTANEFSTPFGTYRGGYVPAIADTFEVQDAAINAELDAVNQGNAFMFPATARGFTKSRVEYNRPLALDLRLLPQHIDKALLFSHLEPRVRDVMRTLRAKGFAGALNRYDPVAYTDLLLPWLNRAAKQTVETPATGWAGKLGDRFFRTMRSRSGMAAMFANVSNALQQLTGLSISALKVKPTYLKAATWRYLRAPTEMAEHVASLSPFMATRQNNEVQQMRSEIEALLINPNVYEKAQGWTAKHAYFLQSAFQNTVDTITWSAAFDQAIGDGHSEADAVRAANAAVRETQGSLQPEDISRFESGPAFVRLFTQFQSYFNMQANLLGTEFAKVAQDMGLKKGAGRLFYVFLLGFLVPAWFSEAIVQAMRGGPGDDDGDGYLDEFLAAFFGAPARNAAAMVPVVGQSAVLVANAFNRKPYDDRMSTAPAVSMIESAASAPHSIYKAIADDGKASRAIRDTLTLVSITTGIPVAALGKPLGYAADVAQGRVEPTGPVDAARGLVSGAASPDSKR